MYHIVHLIRVMDRKKTYLLRHGPTASIIKLLSSENMFREYVSKEESERAQRAPQIRQISERNVASNFSLIPCSTRNVLKRNIVVQEL